MYNRSCILKATSDSAGDDIVIQVVNGWSDVTTLSTTENGFSGAYMYCGQEYAKYCYLNPYSWKSLESPNKNRSYASVDYFGEFDYFTYCEYNDPTFCHSFDGCQVFEYIDYDYGTYSSVAASGSYDCQNDVIECLDGMDCNIWCDKYYQCEGASLICPSNNYQCNIYCSGQYGCRSMSVFASEANVAIHCNYDNSCEYMNITVINSYLFVNSTRQNSFRYAG